MNLLYDSFILSEGSQLSWNKSLKLTEYLPKETHFLPWIVGSRGFLTLHKRLYGTDAHEYFKVSQVVAIALTLIKLIHSS